MTSIAKHAHDGSFFGKLRRLPWACIRSVVTLRSKGRESIQLVCCLLDISFVNSENQNYRIDGLHISEAIDHGRLSSVRWQRRTLWPKARSRRGSSHGGARSERTPPRADYEKLG